LTGDLYETDGIFVTFDFYRRRGFRCRARPNGFCDKLWREIDDEGLQRRQLPRPIDPHAYRTFTLDKNALGNMLRKAPMEFTEAARNNSPVVTDSDARRRVCPFYIEESPIFESGAAAKISEN
jgi:hypothetical protein